MAKQSRKRGAGKAGKSTPAAVAKKAASKKGRQGGSPSKGTRAALARTKHEQIRIGLQKKSRPPRVFTTGASNTFLVFGDSIGTHAESRKTVTLRATRHTWVNPPTIANNGSDRLRITADLRPVAASKRGLYADDDMTVTIVLDQGTTNEDTTLCTFGDVEYDA
jgi:hypothetical protein